MNERRRCPRLDTSKLDLVCKKIMVDGSESRFYKTQDIGRYAVNVLFSADLVTAGELLRLEFVLPNREKVISCTGKVLWVDEVSRREHAVGFAAGIKFIDVDEEDRVAIRRFACS